MATTARSSSKPPTGCMSRRACWPGCCTRSRSESPAVPVYLLATLDTKGLEAAFVRDRLRELGLDVVVVDCGCLGQPATTPDVIREAVFEAAQTSLAEVQRQGDRGTA